MTVPGFTLDRTSSSVVRMVSVPLCPDLLDYAALGEADNFRGSVVRAFFWLLDRVMPVGAA